MAEKEEVKSTRPEIQREPRDRELLKSRRSTWSRMKRHLVKEATPLTKLPTPVGNMENIKEQQRLPKDQKSMNLLSRQKSKAVPCP